MSGVARIRRLKVSNYRSLGEGVDIAFGPLTALVVPNGAFESNVSGLPWFGPLDRSPRFLDANPGASAVCSSSAASPV